MNVHLDPRASVLSLTPVHLWHRARQKGFLYASFALQTYHNAVFFQSFHCAYDRRLPACSDDSVLRWDWCLMTAPVLVWLCCCNIKQRPAPFLKGLRFTASCGLFFFFLVTPVHDGFFFNFYLKLTFITAAVSLDQWLRQLFLAFFRARTVHPWSWNNPEADDAV